MDKISRSKRHRVVHEFSGKTNFFKVYSDNGNVHNVAVQMTCDCRYMGVQGIANNGVCSHILAVLREITRTGNIQLKTESDNLTQMKRNTALNLIEPSNRRINEIRISSGEGAKHIKKKQEICNALIEQKKQFITEARFIGGGIADILVLDDFQVIEIVDSESEESIQNKIQKYPFGLKFKVVRVEE